MSMEISKRDLKDFFGDSSTPRKGLLRLDNGDKGKEYRVIQVLDKEDISQRLIPFDILPGSKIKLLENPAVGAIMVKKGQDEIALSREIASKIMVKPWRKRRKNRFGRRGN